VFTNGSGVIVGYGFINQKGVLGPGDLNGDQKMDVIGIDSSGVMKLFTGNGTSGWINGAGISIGSGW